MVSHNIGLHSEWNGSLRKSCSGQFRIASGRWILKKQQLTLVLVSNDRPHPPTSHYRLSHYTLRHSPPEDSHLRDYSVAWSSSSSLTACNEMRCGSRGGIGKERLSTDRLGDRLLRRGNTKDKRMEKVESVSSVLKALISLGRIECMLMIPFTLCSPDFMFFRIP